MIQKFVIFAVLGSLLVQFATGQWPWVLWASRDGRQREKRARALLGLPADAARTDIIDAHRRLITQIHPDRGGSNEAVFEANDARDLLLERLGPRNRA